MYTPSFISAGVERAAVYGCFSSLGHPAVQDVFEERAVDLSGNERESANAGWNAFCKLDVSSLLSLLADCSMTKKKKMRGEEGKETQDMR